MRKIRVLLVDDHKIFAEGIESIFSDNSLINVSGIAYGYDELISILGCEAIDIVMLDAFMPGLNAIEVISVIRAKFPKVKVILTSGNDEEIIASEGFGAGAFGYLMKSASANEFSEAIHSVYNGNKYVCKLPDKPLKGNKLLNQFENQVIKFLANGLSYTEVAHMLRISNEEVESCTLTILDKLKLTNTIELAKFAIHNKMIEL